MGKRSKIICFAMLILFAGVLCFGIVFLVQFPVKYKNYVNLYSSAEVPPELMLGVIKAESGFDENAKSSAGALGLMQVKLSTANYVANIYGLSTIASEEELFNPQLNIQLGALYLKYLHERFGGNLTYILVAYNAGETITSEWVSSGSFNKEAYPESLNYAKKVEKYTKIYKKLL